VTVSAVSLERRLTKLVIGDLFGEDRRRVERLRSGYIYRRGWEIRRGVVPSSSSLPDERNYVAFTAVSRSGFLDLFLAARSAARRFMFRRTGFSGCSASCLAQRSSSLMS